MKHYRWALQKALGDFITIHVSEENVRKHATTLGYEIVGKIECTEKEVNEKKIVWFNVYKNPSTGSLPPTVYAGSTLFASEQEAKATLDHRWYVGTYSIEVEA